jgi:hypothetical protein
VAGPLDQAAQALVNAGATVEGASSYLAFFNAQLEQAAVLIREASPTGFQDLQFGLKNLEQSAHARMRDAARVAAGSPRRVSSSPATIRRGDETPVAGRLIVDAQRDLTAHPRTHIAGGQRVSATVGVPARSGGWSRGLPSGVCCGRLLVGR